MLLFWSCKSPGSCNLLPTTSTDQALSVVVVTVVVTTCTQFCESLLYWIISNHRFTHPPSQPATPPTQKENESPFIWDILRVFPFQPKLDFFFWADFRPSGPWLLSYRSFFADKPPWFWLSFSLVAGHLFYYPGGKKVVLRAVFSLWVC